MSMISGYIFDAIKEGVESFTIGSLHNDTGMTVDVIAGDLFLMTDGNNPLLRAYVNKLNGHLYFDVIRTVSYVGS